MSRTAVITAQEVINDLHRVSRNHEGAVSITDYMNEGIFSHAQVKRVLGLDNVKKATLAHVLDTTTANNDDLSRDTLAMLIRKWNRNMTKEGVKFSRDNFVKNNPGVSKHMINRVFVTWSKAVEEAGI